MTPALEGLPGMEATVLAEQALLGTLLLRPHTLTAVAPWLEPQHFYLPHHTALFTALRHLAATGHPAVTEARPGNEQGLAWVTEATALAVEQAPGLTPSDVHTLVNACPEPGHAAAYGRMVLAGHARRTLAEHAARLAQTARRHQDGEPRVEAVCRQADALARVLESLAQQWRPYPGSHTRIASVPPPAVQGREEGRLEDERAFLSAATTQPAALKELRAYLHAEDFTDPVHAGLFGCLAALVHRGEAIDPVTVLWEAQHRGLLTHTTPKAILTACAPSGADPAYWASRILRHSLLETAATTADRIGHLAADPTLTPHQLITATHRALGDLTAVRLRRHRTHPDQERALPAGRSTPPPAPRPRDRPPPTAAAPRITARTR
ncbi:DnaB-like helicase N-terminal domain-containing protein [Streptomyces klenkii]